MREFSNGLVNFVAEDEEAYRKERSPISFRKVYCTGTPTNNKEESNSQSYLIRIGYEEIDLQGLPAGNYWWQDDEGNVQKIIKE